MVNSFLWWHHLFAYCKSVFILWGLRAHADDGDPDDVDGYVSFPYGNEGGNDIRVHQ